MYSVVGLAFKLSFIFDILNAADAVSFPFSLPRISISRKTRGKGALDRGALSFVVVLRPLY